MFNQNEMIQQLGDSCTNKAVERFKRFAFLPSAVIDTLAEQALPEQWGGNKFVLKKYLAVHVPWSIEQGHFTTSSNQFYVRAGHLQTRYGTPLYLVFESNEGYQQPYILRHAGADVSAPELPSEPCIPQPASVPVGAEIVMLHEHILGDHPERVPFLANTPFVAQMCAISGAIQWSLNRGLQLPYWYFGRMDYVVPVYLQSREDITKAPDLIAPIQIIGDGLVVRTVLKPYMPYANSRVSVKRHDKLPPWMLAAWDEYADKLTEEEMDEPEKMCQKVEAGLVDVTYDDVGERY